MSYPAVFLFNRTGKFILLAFIPIKVPGTTICGELAMTTLSDLTSRELKILQLVLAGYTNKAIAAEVFISEKTVEFHLGNIYAKIGVRTRMLAGVWALQHGILSETSEIPS